MKTQVQYKHKVVHLFVTLLALFATVSFQNVSIGYTQAQAQLTNLESYNDRPDILKIKARSHSDKLGIDWNDLKAAHLSFVAQLLAIYPQDVDLYFLARDSELLYDTAKLVTENTPDAKRIHLLNISRANMKDKLVVQYLAQNGISEETLAKGKKVLFVDTGFSGTIPRVISNNFPVKYHGQLKTHLVVSSNPKHPSSRSFLYYLSPLIVQQSPSEMHGSIVSYEHMPRYTDRSHVFQKVGDKILPMSSTSEANDGSVSKSKSLEYMEDLKATWQNPLVQTRYQAEVNQNRTLLNLMTDGTLDSAEVLNQLFAKETDATKRSQVLVFDLLDASKNLDIDFKTPIPEIKSLQIKTISALANHSVKNLLIEKQPELTPYLEDPETHIPKLVQMKKWKTLGVLIDADIDAEFNKILIRSLFSQAAIKEHRALQSLFLEKKDRMTNDTVLTAILKLEKTEMEKMSDVVLELVTQMSQASYKIIPFDTAEFLIKIPATKAREIIEAMINNFKPQTNYETNHPFLALVEYYFPDPVSYQNEDLLIKLIKLNNKDLNEKALSIIFRKAESVALKKTLRILLNSNNLSLAYSKLPVFEQNRTIEFLDELKSFIETNMNIVPGSLRNVARAYENHSLKSHFKILAEAASIHSHEQRRKYLKKNWLVGPLKCEKVVANEI